MVRVWLSVPAGDRRAASKLGARYDRSSKRYFVEYEDDPRRFTHWISKPPRRPRQARPTQLDLIDAIERASASARGDPPAGGSDE